MRCVGLLIAIRISGTAALRGWMVGDAGLASGTAELEPVGVPGDSDWVSVPGVAVLGVWDSEPGEPVLGVWDSEPGEPVLGVWDSEPGEPVLGVWDSEPVWALAGKASIAPRAATFSKRQCLRKADRCI
jgi:hypothetical protein